MPTVGLAAGFSMDRFMTDLELFLDAQTGGLPDLARLLETPEAGWITVGQFTPTPAVLEIVEGQLQDLAIALQAGLDDAVKPYDNNNYEGVDHGFHNDTTPRYDKDAAELAWQRTLEFFATNLA